MSVDSSKYGLQQVFKITLFDIATGQAYVQLEDMKESKFTVGQETTYATGGRGAPKLIGFDHSKTAMISGSNGLITDGLILVQTGSDVSELTNSTGITYTDMITTTVADEATTKYKATGTVGAEIEFVYLQNKDGSLGSKFAQAATVAAGKFAYAPLTKKITFNTGSVPVGSNLVVFYKPTVASAKEIISYTDVFSKSVKVVADCLLRDACTKSDYQGQIVFEAGKVKGGFEWNVSEKGEPTAQAFEVEALKPCNGTELWKMFVYDDGDLS